MAQTQRAAAKSIESVPESPVPTSNTNANTPTSWQQNIEPIANRAPVAERSARHYEVAVAETTK